jgi:pimeloyl-ACP methyl ester carboxylesterase
VIPEEDQQLRLRIHGDATLPTLIYLPGLHGDWTLVASFAAAVSGRLRLVVVTYPRTLPWSLDDHAQAIRSALAGREIRRGWLLGESFGSQIAWPLVAKSDDMFAVAGLILAGGFVRHSVPPGVRLARLMSTRWPRWFVRAALTGYGRYASFRHQRAPETLANLQEFITRRLEPLDRLAIHHRLGLIAENDLRPIACQAHLPVYHLGGLMDPIVPVLPARLWLRRHCPGYRGGRLLWRADHNVLGTAPQEAADQIVQWMRLRSETDQ